jgi:hypothetical protein
VKHSGVGRSGLRLVPLAAGKGSHFLALSFERGLVLWQRVWLDRGSGLLAGEPALLWCCFWHDSGLRSTRLHLLPLLMGMTLLEGEAGIRLRCHRPRWNCHHGLSDRSVLRPWCGCDGSKRSPRVVPPGRGKAEATLPARCREELLVGVIYHGSLRGWCLATS